MFNISFAELILFSTVALLVLGPEKLPQTLRSALLYYRKIKTQINQFQTDFEHELDLIELKTMMKEELLKIKAMEDQLKSQLDAMQSEISSLQDQNTWVANPMTGSNQIISTHPTVSLEKKISMISALKPYSSKPYTVPYLSSYPPHFNARISA